MARTRRKAPAPTDGQLADQAADAHYAAVAEAQADQPEPSFNPAEFDPEMQQQAQAVVQQVAESTRIEPETYTPPTTASGGPGTVREQGFAERVKREPGYTGAGPMDIVAGVKLNEYHDSVKKIYLSIIKFDEMPSKAVTTMMHDRGFNFEGANKEWYRPIRYPTRQQDRLDAERVYAEACKLVRQDKGIGHGFGGASVG